MGRFRNDVSPSEGGWEIQKNAEKYEKSTKCLPNFVENSSKNYEFHAFLGGLRPPQTPPTGASGPGWTQNGLRPNSGRIRDEHGLKIIQNGPKMTQNCPKNIIKLCRSSGGTSSAGRFLLVPMFSQTSGRWTMFGAVFVLVKKFLR